MRGALYLRNTIKNSCNSFICRSDSSFIQQCRFTFRGRSPQQFIKNRDSDPSFVRSYSASNSKPKIGLIGWYLAKLESRPVITKTLTTSLIFAAADLTAQQFVSSWGSLDLIRTARMASYGLIFLGPSQHVWFDLMSKALPKRDVLSTLKKTFMGQSLYGPANTVLFFSYNAALQGESSDEIVARLKRDVIPTLKTGLLYWPICDFVTYKFVPPHLQETTTDFADLRDYTLVFTDVEHVYSYSLLA